LMGWPRRRNLNAGLILLPMAGMAIGLANNVSTQFPMMGAEVASIVLAAVAVFETIGPPIVARALHWAREVGDGDDEHPDDWTQLHAQTEEKDEPAHASS
jgi:hypothetical protein